MFTFRQCARDNKDKVFFFTKVGCGIAGFTAEEVAEIVDSVDLQDEPNVILPVEFSR